MAKTILHDSQIILKLLKINQKMNLVFLDTDDIILGSEDSMDLLRFYIIETFMVANNLTKKNRVKCVTFDNFIYKLLVNDIASTNKGLADSEVLKFAKSISDDEVAILLKDMYETCQDAVSKQ